MLSDTKIVIMEDYIVALVNHGQISHTHLYTIATYPFYGIKLFNNYHTHTSLTNTLKEKKTGYSSIKIRAKS